MFAYDMALEYLDLGIVPFFIPTEDGLGFATLPITPRLVDKFESPNPNVRLGTTVGAMLRAGEILHARS